MPSDEERSLNETTAPNQLAEIEAVYNAVPVGLCVFDRELRYVRINERLAAINGLPAADHIGKTMREVIPNLADVLEGFAERVLRTGEPVRDVEVSGTLGSAPDELRHWREHWQPIKDHEGNVLGVSVVVEEITRRKQAEEELSRGREDLNRAQAVGRIGSWRMNVQTNELDWSDENWRIFGVPGGTPLTYETFLETVHPEDRDFVHEKWTAALRGEAYDIEHRIVVGDTVKWVRERAELEFDADGRLLGGFGTTQDITDRKRAEESLQRSEQKLREANELLEQRVAERTTELETLTHKLRKMSAELSQAEQQQRERLAQILHNNVQQLLVAARYNLNVLRPHCVGETCRDPLERVDELLSDSIEATRGLALDLSPPVVYEESLATAMAWLANRMGELHGLTVDLDVEGLGQVPEDLRVFLFMAVQELLFNVVKHADGRHATVKAARDDKTLCISVRDGGKGFDPKAILPGEAGGAGGFGLFTIRERVELLGGCLQVEAKPSGGCTVTVVVPVART